MVGDCVYRLCYHLFEHLERFTLLFGYRLGDGLLYRTYHPLRGGTFTEPGRTLPKKGEQARK